MLKEVFFYEWCYKCKHWNNGNEFTGPCNECLEEPAAEDSHKPLYFEERDDKEDE